jgi:hypothetical protein
VGDGVADGCGEDEEEEVDVDVGVGGELIVDDGVVDEPADGVLPPQAVTASPAAARGTSSSRFINKIPSGRRRYQGS